MSDVVAFSGSAYPRPEEELGTADAAARLGVSRREVQRLARAGDIPATRTVGDAYVVDFDGLSARARSDIERGRPWSEEVAWAALWSLAGLETPWLDYYQRRRLGVRMDGITLTRIVNSTRRRAITRRYRGSALAIETLKQSLILTGANAGVVDTGHEPTTAVDGYLDELLRPELILRLDLVPDVRGSIVIRSTEFKNVLWFRKEMPAPVVAADLMGSEDPFERDAGRAVLEQLLANAAATSSAAGSADVES